MFQMYDTSTALTQTRPRVRADESIHNSRGVEFCRVRRRSNGAKNYQETETRRFKKMFNPL